MLKQSANGVLDTREAYLVIHAQSVLQRETNDASRTTDEEVAFLSILQECFILSQTCRSSKFCCAEMVLLQAAK
jgi:hypothetical protein